MSKKNYSISLLIALIFLLGWSWGCSQKSGAPSGKADVGVISDTKQPTPLTKDPQETLRQFAAALKKNDEQASLQMVTINSKQRWQRIFKVVSANEREVLAQAIESAEIVEQNETMVKARIRFFVPGVSGENDLIYLRKENNEWKISAL